jgi:hypothetical protein
MIGKDDIFGIPIESRELKTYTTGCPRKRVIQNTNLKQDTFICSNLQIISASLMLCRPVTTLLIVVYEVRESSERYSKRTSQTRNADSSLVRSEMQCISMSMWKVEWMMCLLSVWLTER